LDGDGKSDGTKHTIDELFKLLENTPTWKPTAEQKTSLPAREPVIRTAKELFSLQLPEVKWIVLKILPQGLIILAGKPKIGKSWIVLHIALSVSLGGVALGSVDVEKGDVLYLALEDTERRLKDRLNKLLSGGIPPDNFYYCTNDWGRLPEAGVRIEKFLDEHKDTRLIVVDTLQKIRPPSKKGAGVYE
jgi:predicted ATP-dependent serine protease